MLLFNTFLQNKKNLILFYIYKKIKIYLLRIGYLKLMDISIQTEQEDEQDEEEQEDDKEEKEEKDEEDDNDEEESLISLGLKKDIKLIKNNPNKYKWFLM